MQEIIISVLQRTIVAGTPLLLGTIGGIIHERSGILNLGIEGMMALGAVSAFITTLLTGHPALGMLVAVLVGGASALIHAFACITLQANQVISGLALTMLGIGVSGFWGKPYIGIPLEVKINKFKIPVLGDIPIIGEILFYQDIFFYLAIFLGLGTWFFLMKTRLGITLRATGESPKAVAAQGLNPSLIRYLATIVGGAFSGLAGAHLSIAYSKSWIEGLTGGRGWIVVALIIFSFWNPLRAFLGAFLFGGIFVLQYILQPLGISPNFLSMLPYLATLLVLLFSSIKGARHMASPASLGEIFRKEDR
ncbi:MAG: ABC transporter permease [Spirochaetales bacterium]|nr:ABC transporter permease [Spirochaetales bacterium]